MRWIMAASVVVVRAFATRLLGFGLQQEGAVDDDRLPRREPRGDLDLAAEIAPAPDATQLEAPRPERHEDGPVLARALERRRRHRDDRRARVAERQPRRRGHA